MSKIIVGMADYAVARKPTRLITMGLGSCVGITLYDPYVQIGGLVHIMLPSVNHGRSKANKAKFADTGIAYLMEEMQKKGAVKRRVVAKIAGGSSMFSYNNESQMNIGERNVEMTKKVLDELKVQVVSEDTGKDYGRTIELNTETGMLQVRSVRNGNKEI